MADTEKKNVEERVAGLEGSVAHISQSLVGMSKENRETSKALRDSMESMQTSFRDSLESMQSSFRDEMDGLRDNSRTQPAPLIAAATLILVVGGSFFALITSSLSRIETQMADNAVRSTYETKELDRALQREMRDLDRISSTALSSLGEHFTQQLAATRELHDSESRWIKDGLHSGASWRASHAKQSASINAEQSATIRENRTLINILLTKSAVGVPKSVPEPIR